MYEHPEPGDYFFDNAFKRRPEWKLRIMPDDFVYYDCDMVLQGTLREWQLQPGTLSFHELVISGDDPGDPDGPPSWGPAWDVHQIRVVLSPSDGAWIVGWGDKPDLSAAFENVRRWRALLVEALVERCGWAADDLPLGAVILATHHLRSELQIPEDSEAIPIFDKSQLAHLAYHLGELGTPGDNGEGSRHGLRLVADLLDVGHFIDGNEASGLDVELPSWLISEASPHTLH